MKNDARYRKRGVHAYNRMQAIKSLVVINHTMQIEHAHEQKHKYNHTL